MISLSHTNLISLVEDEVGEALHGASQAVVVQMVVEATRRSDHDVGRRVGPEASGVRLDVRSAHHADERDVVEGLSIREYLHTCVGSSETSSLCVRIDSQRPAAHGRGAAERTLPEHDESAEDTPCARVCLPNLFLRLSIDCTLTRW